MNLSVEYLLPEGKVNEITRKVTGYFENDIWDAENAAFNDFRKSEWGKTHRKMDFSVFSSKLKNEVKFFILLVFKKMICNCTQLYIIMPDLLNSFLNFLRNFIQILIVLQI